MTKINIPAGLFDENIEIFSFNEKPFALYNGQCIPLSELPEEFLGLLWDDLQKNEAALMALELSGYHCKCDKIHKYALCRFGGFDSTPDISNGKLNCAEYFDCGFRGKCSMEGIVCKSITFNGHILTPNEMKMMQLLATEDTLPVIAEKLEMSMNSFENHKKTLFEKMGVLSRARLVAIAFINNLLKPSLCSP